MSENTKPGRQPFERWKLKQDFCNLEYGVGVCYANGWNLVANSMDLSDGDNWNDSNNNYGYTTGIADPDGFNRAMIIEKDRDDKSRYLRSEQNLPVGDSAVLYYSFYVKAADTDSADFFTFYVQLTSAAYSSFVIDIDGQSISGFLNEEEFNDYDLEVIDDDWMHITASIDIDKLMVPSDIWLLPMFDSSAVGTKVLFYGLQSSPVPISGYVPTYGDTVSPSGTSPCYNTRATCQVPDVYDRGELELKFCKNQQRLPKGEYHIPSVATAKITAGSINPGGADSNVSAMGKRATISVSFEDHTHSDLLVDPYRLERGYDPKTRGTFWTKWRARNPYYMHRELVYESGYMLDGEVVDSINRTFFITGFSGPDGNGKVTLSGKDVLTLAADDKAKAPFASTGKLAADITAGATSATLTPTGIGDLEYPASGWVRIGKEVLEFTRSGDTLTIDGGKFGTSEEEHEQDDTVQLCLRYDTAAPADILYDLLHNYAGIPDTFLDKTQWDGEQLGYLPRRYNTIITEPEGVNKLVAEMCQQMYFTTWFDERESLVKMRAVRPAEGDTVYELNDQLNLAADSVQWTDKADELVTQVWVYYGQINPTEKLDQGDNYAALDVIADPTSESPDRNNLIRVKTIYSRWIDSANGAAAIDLGNRIIARYGSAPRECTFKLDAKDRDVWLADFVRLTSRLRLDFSGQPVPVNMQVFESQETTPGTTFTYKAKEYIEQLTDGDDVQDPDVRNIIISADQLNVNLRQLHDSQYAPPTGTETITCTIRSGVTIGGYAADDALNIPYDQRDTSNDFYDGGTGSVSGLVAGQIPILQRRGIGSVRTTASGASYPDGGGNADFEIREYPISTAFDTGDWPAGVTLKLVVEGGGRVLGEGGNGSTHGLSEKIGSLGREAAPGGDGGHCLRVQYPIQVTNGGIISGGGAGGGFAFAYVDVSGVTYMAPGGGGAGFEISDTSSNKILGGSMTTREPSVGSATAGGSGGLIKTAFNEYIGGSGGVLAASGNTATIDGGLRAAGGTPGDAIAEGADMVTWINKGDVRGAENI